MTLLGRRLSRWISALGILIAFAALTMPSRAQSGDYVEGRSEITSKTTAQTLDSYSGTYMTYGVCVYYKAKVRAAIYQNDTKVAENAADGGSDYCFAELDGSGPITLGDTYTQVADHSIYAVYMVSYGGQTYYENPFLYSGFYPGSPDPSGTDYPSDGGGDFYMVSDTIEVGQTAAWVTAAAPTISDISPSTGTVGTSGTIAVNGENLIDPWTQTATPAITGSGVSLSVGANPTDQQLDLNYSIAQGATAGPQSLTLATTFGTSNAVTFTVLYPAAQVTGISPGTWTAGQSYQGVQITGTNFGSTPTVQLSDPSISVSQPYNTSTAGGASTTYVNVTVPSTTPSEQVTVTLVPGSGGNRFTQPPGGPSISGSNTVTVMGIQQNACPQGGQMQVPDFPRLRQRDWPSAALALCLYRSAEVPTAGMVSLFLTDSSLHQNQLLPILQRSSRRNMHLPDSSPRPTEPTSSTEVKRHLEFLALLPQGPLLLQTLRLRVARQ